MLDTYLFQKDRFKKYYLYMGVGCMKTILMEKHYMDIYLMKSAL